MSLRSLSHAAPRAVVLDLDGVIVDTEEVWDRERRAYVAAHGGTWKDGATRAMQGMSAPSGRATCATSWAPTATRPEISRAVARRRRRRGPARAAAAARARSRAVNALAERLHAGARVVGQPRGHRRGRSTARASRERFAATVSSEEVARGKPAPDVYLEAARRIGVDPTACAAVEDSSNGLRAAHAAGMVVIATPNHAFPPAPDALALAAVVVDGIREVTPELAGVLMRTPRVERALRRGYFIR